MGQNHPAASNMGGQMSDQGMAQALYGRLAGAQAKNGSLGLKVDVLHDIPADDPHGGQGVSLNALLVQALNNDTVVVDNAQLQFFNATAVRVTGHSLLMSDSNHVVPFDATLGYVNGRLHVDCRSSLVAVAHAKQVGPVSGGNSTLPFVNTPEYVLANTHFHATASAASAAAAPPPPDGTTMHPGLNLLGTVNASGTPVHQLLMAAVTSSGAAHLSVSLEQLTSAPTATTTMATTATSTTTTTAAWSVEALAVSGLVSSGPSAGGLALSGFPTKLALGPGITLTNLKITVQKAANVYGVSGDLLVTVPGQTAPVSIVASGGLNGQTVSLNGTVSGLSLAGSNLIFDSISCDVTGTLNGTHVDNVAGALQLSFALQAATVNARLALPLTSPSAGATLTVGDVRLTHGVVLASASLVLRPVAPQVALTGVLGVSAGPSLTPLRVQAALDFGSNGWAVSGKVPSWPLVVGGAHIAVSNVALSLSGPQYAGTAAPGTPAAGLKGSLTAAAAFGGMTFVLTAALPAAAGGGSGSLELVLTATSAVTLQSIADSVSGAGSAAGVAVPSSLRSQLLLATLTSAVVTIDTAPLALSATGALAGLGGSTAAVDVKLALAAPAPGSPAGTAWSWGAGFALTSSGGPKLSAAVGGGDASFDALPLTAGYFVVASGPQAFTFAVPAAHTTCSGPGAVNSGTLALSVSRGVSMQLLLPAAHFSAYLTDTDPTGCAYAVGSFSGASLATLSLSVDLPRNLPLGGTPPVATLNATVTMHPAAVQPRYTVDASAVVATGVANSPLAVTVAGSLGSGATAFALSGTASNWVVASVGATPLVITAVAVSVSGKRAAAAGSPLALAGKINGQADFGASQVSVELDIPAPAGGGNGLFKLNAPTLVLTPRVKLVNCSITVSSGSKAIAGTAVVDVGLATPLELKASGVISATTHSVTAELLNWQVAGLPSVLARDVKLAMTGAVNPTTKAVTWTGTLTSAVDLYGASAALSLAFPVTATAGGVDLSVSGAQFGPNLAINSAKIHLARTAPQASFSAAADILTGVKSSPLALTLAGSMSPTSVALSGTAANWKIGTAFTVTSVKVSLTGTKSAAGAFALQGTLSGDMLVAGVQALVDVSFPTPVAGGTLLMVDVPSLKLSPQVTMQQVTLTVKQSTPSLVYTLSGQAQVDMGANVPPLSLAASGSVGASSFDLTGSLASWIIPVGHYSLVAKSVKLEILKQASATSVSGTVSASVALGTFSLNLAAAFPPPAGSSLDLTLTLAQGQSLTLGQLASGLVDPVVQNGMKVPPAMKTGIWAAGLRVPKLVIKTAPAPSFMAVGQVTLGGQTSNAQLSVYKNDTAARWELIVGAYLPAGFAFSSVVPGLTAFDKYPFPEAAFLVSSVEADFSFDPSVPVRAGKASTVIPSPLRVVDGVAFASVVPFATVSSLKALQLWGSVAQLDVYGSFGVDLKSVVLKAALPNAVSIGAHVKATGYVELQTLAPQMQLGVDATVTIHAHDTPLACTGALSLATSGAFSLTAATTTPYTFNVGVSGFTLQGITLDLTFTTGASGTVAGFLNGSVAFQGYTLGASLQFPQPKAAAGMELRLELANTQALAISKAIAGTCGNAAAANFVAPPAFKDMTSAQLLQATIALTTSPLSFKATGQVSLFRFNGLLGAEIEVLKDPVTNQWGFGMGVSLANSFTFDTLAPTIGALGSYPFSSGAVAISDEAGQYTFHTANGWPLAVSHGVAFKALVETTGNLAVVRRWTNIQNLYVETSFSWATSAFHLEGGINTDWHLLGRLYFTAAALYMDVGGPAGADVGIHVNLAVKLGSRAGDQLNFVGDLKVGAADIRMSVATTNDWPSPFGIRGVTIKSTELALGISYADALPDMFGISGGLEIGGVTGTATVYADLVANAYVVAGSLTAFNLYKIVHFMTANLVSGGLAQTVLAVTLNDCSLGINAGAKAVTFNQQTFMPGVFFHVGAFDLWGTFKGTATVAVSTTSGVYMNASLSPFSLLGGILAFSGASSASAPGRLIANIGANIASDAVTIDARGTFLGISLASYIHLSDTTMDIDMWFVSEIFNTSFQFNLTKGTPAAPVDFSFYAGFENNVRAWLADTVSTKMVQFKNTIDAKLSSEQQKLTAWKASNQPTIDSKNAEIAKYEAADKAKLSSAQQKLYDAQSSLSSAQSKVNSLNADISADKAAKRSCKWYDVACHAHNAWLDTKIAALWVAYHTATAALDVAKGAVSAAASSLSEAKKVVVADPRVLALKSEVEALKVAEASLQAAVTAAEDIVNGAGHLAGWTLMELNTCFYVRSASIAASSATALHSSGSVTLRVSGTFMKKQKDLTLSLPFPPGQSTMLNTVWSVLKKDVGL